MSVIVAAHCCALAGKAGGAGACADGGAKGAGAMGAGARDAGAEGAVCRCAGAMCAVCRCCVLMCDGCVWRSCCVRGCIVGCKSSCLMVVPSVIGTRPFMSSGAGAVSERGVERGVERGFEVLAIPRLIVEACEAAYGCSHISSNSGGGAAAASVDGAPTAAMAPTPALSPLAGLLSLARSSSSDQPPELARSG